MTVIQSYLKSYFDLDLDNLERVASYFKLENLAKNEIYTSPAWKCQKLSFVKSGSLRIYKDTENKEVTQWIATEGEFVTDLSSLIFDTYAQWNIQALSDCQIFTISKSDYLALGSKIPEWNEIEKLFLSKCFLMMESRIFSFLSMTAEERYTQFMSIKGQLFNDVPHHYLASMLGMTPETLSRLRKKSIS